MSASIPIPGRPQDDLDDSPSNIGMYGGLSLPTARRSFNNPSTQRHHPTPFTTQDDIATSWPPRPSVRLVSRSARRWQTGHSDTKKDSPLPHRSTAFEPWDFSEIATTSNAVMTAFERGTARAERPPREGVCGTYFIRRVESTDSVLCVFKPVDEEAGDLERSPPICVPESQDPGSIFTLGPHHGLSGSPTSDDYGTPPNGLNSSAFDKGSRMGKNDVGFRAGEGAYKEVAAYLLDHERFARVPQTALATCSFASDLPEKNKISSEDSESQLSSPSSQSSSDSDDYSHMRTKMGAFQVFVENSGDAEDFGPGVFSKDQVHKIAVLDIRTLNHDRHGGNILVVKSKTPGTRFNLVPIDHGYILPDVVKSVPWPVWMDWKMIKEEISSEVKSYISRLDPVAEARSLVEELDGKLRKGSLRSLKIATTLLQKGVAAGLTLYEIGLLIYTRRDYPCVKSELERIISEAEDAGAARGNLFCEEVSSADASTDSGIFMSTLTDGSNYRSTGCLTAFQATVNESDGYIDDYIVKYATKLVSETVRRVANNKFSSKGSRGMNPSKPLGRARSIPDFGIGFRPIHAMSESYPRLSTYGESGPTPLSSPVDTDRPSPLQSLEESIMKPIRFPIDSGHSSIMLPPLKPVARGTEKPKPKPIRPMHRRNASECLNVDKIGSLGELGVHGQPPLRPITRAGEAMKPKSARPMHRRNASERLNGDASASLQDLNIPSGRPPFFKPASLFKPPSTGRKSSPLGPFEALWNDEDPHVRNEST